MIKNGLNKYPSIRWGIRSKLNIVMTLLIISVVSILTCIQISDQKKMMEDELNKRTFLMKENLIERGRSFVSNLTVNVEKDIAAFNFSGVIEAVSSSVKKNRDIQYAVLVSSSGVVFVHTSHPEVRRSILNYERTLAALNQNDIYVREYTEQGESFIEIAAPVQISTKPWGVIRVIYTKKYLDMDDT